MTGPADDPAGRADGDAAHRPGLPVAPGMCAACQYASVKDTRRGTTYLRCTRASWDDRLARYPRLPVTWCPGFAQLS
jgi:hypothetical protein